MKSSIALAFAATAAAWSVLAASQTKTAFERTVYFTARDQVGAHVPGLSPADISVRDGGREREIRRVGPSRTRLKLALAIDEGLSPDMIIRQAVQRFVQQLQGSADIAIYLVGVGNAKLVDYTSDQRTLVDAINKFPLRAQGGGNLVESLYELARLQRPVEGRRVIVILATEIPQRTTVTANGVLDQLRDSGAVLYAATLVGPAGTMETRTPESGNLETVEEIERDRALNDGTKQSGGLRLGSLRREGFQPLLDRISRELLSEYEVTYVIPAGSSSDGRLSITSKRKGITVRGPTRVPRL
jgi:VWFA-related protein